ncbi:MAG: hypothetical protein ACYCYI_05140 [Saccharofermentanales bacterium]
MNDDRQILRELAKKYARIAALDVQKQKIGMWKKLNTLKPQRPMVTIDQLPWNELNINDELTLLCEDPFYRTLENQMRMEMYKFNHFPVDMVVNDYLSIPKTVYGNRIGPDIEQDIILTDATNSVTAHRYIDILDTEEKLDAIEFPVVTADKKLDSEMLAKAQEALGDIIPVRLTGHTIHCGMWDFITMLRSVEDIMYDFADRPEFILKTINNFVDMAISMVDQYEELELMDYGQTLIHCTGAFTDELPSVPKAGAKQSAKDVWAFGLAQALGPVSPEMYNEFELKPIKRLLERFGLMYYGCCDPIDRKIEYIRNISNIRKISVSPWANKALCAELMHGDYVFSSKPNPSYLAFDAMDEDAIRNELLEVAKVSKQNNTNCEFILKDVSTVRYKPQNLFRWAQIAMEVAES